MRGDATTTNGRCSKRMMRGEARRRDGGMTRGREGLCDDRRLNNQMARQEDKRVTLRDNECSQVCNSTYTAPIIV